ncbi:MAG: ORF6N domain-containing protein [Verrucomicrobia bacterium]|nr:ORF6N domain-containing protein [Verrucomicrobiota bacterium]
MAKTAAPEPLEPLIQVVRGERIILDVDLARIYGVPTKRLNEQVKRNTERFPTDFAFRLTTDEAVKLRRSRSRFAALERADNRSQIATGSQKHRDPRFLPSAFTEHGAIMAANVLNSSQATQMSVFVVRAFAKMRAVLSDNRQLAKKLAELEKELKGRLDLHETAIVEVLQRVMNILDPPLQPEPKRRQIGFHATDDHKTE